MYLLESSPYNSEFRIDNLIKGYLEKEAKGLDDNDKKEIKDYVWRVVNDNQFPNKTKLLAHYFPDSDRETEQYIIPDDDAHRIITILLENQTIYPILDTYFKNKNRSHFSVQRIQRVIQKVFQVIDKNGLRPRCIVL